MGKRTNLSAQRGKIETFDLNIESSQTLHRFHPWMKQQ